MIYYYRSVVFSAQHSRGRTLRCLEVLLLLCIYVYTTRCSTRIIQHYHGLQYTPALFGAIATAAAAAAGAAGVASNVGGEERRLLPLPGFPIYRASVLVAGGRGRAPQGSVPHQRNPFEMAPKDSETEQEGKPGESMASTHSHRRHHHNHNHNDTTTLTLRVQCVRQPTRGMDVMWAICDGCSSMLIKPPQRVFGKGVYEGGRGAFLRTYTEEFCVLQGIPTKSSPREQQHTGHIYCLLC